MRQNLLLLLALGLCLLVFLLASVLIVLGML